MSNTMQPSTAQRTYTVGYYNPNRWSVQIVVSSINVTLMLKEGEFILDKQGRKINDPVFDAYVKGKHLAKEESTTPVPLIAIPVVKAGQASPTSTHSVTAGTRFTTNTKGQRVPDLLSVNSSPAVPPPQDKPSILSMSVEEARRLGLIPKTREVPESYGVTDTTGAPPKDAPPIRYAVDSNRGQKPAPLPKDLLETTGVDPATVGVRSGLIATMRRGVQQAPLMATETGFLAEAKENLARAGISPASGEPEELPEPEDLDMLPTDPDADTVKIYAGKPGENAEPLQASVLSEAEESALSAGEGSDDASKEGLPYVCSADGKAFRYRSRLNDYVRRKYPDQAEQLMKPYPKE